MPETERNVTEPFGGGDILDFCGICVGGTIGGECLVGDMPDMRFMFGDRESDVLVV